MRQHGGEFGERCGALPRQGIDQRRREAIGSGIGAGHLAQQPGLQLHLSHSPGRLAPSRGIQREAPRSEELAQRLQGLGELLELHDAGRMRQRVQRIDQLDPDRVIRRESSCKLGEPGLQQLDE